MKFLELIIIQSMVVAYAVIAIFDDGNDDDDGEGNSVPIATSTAMHWGSHHDPFKWN